MRREFNKKKKCRAINLGDESKDSSSSTERSEGEEENEVLFAAPFSWA